MTSQKFTIQNFLPLVFAIEAHMSALLPFDKKNNMSQTAAIS